MNGNCDFYTGTDNWLATEVLVQLDELDERGLSDDDEDQKNKIKQTKKSDIQVSD